MGGVAGRMTALVQTYLTALFFSLEENNTNVCVPGRRTTTYLVSAWRANHPPPTATCLTRYRTAYLPHHAPPHPTPPHPAPLPRDQYLFVIQTLICVVNSDSIGCSLSKRRARRSYGITRRRTTLPWHSIWKEKRIVTTFALLHVISSSAAVFSDVANDLHTGTHQPPLLGQRMFTHPSLMSLHTSAAYASQLFSTGLFGSDVLYSQYRYVCLWTVWSLNRFCNIFLLVLTGLSTGHRHL